MAIFSYEMKVGIGDTKLTENNSLVSYMEENQKESNILIHKDSRSETVEQHSTHLTVFILSVVKRKRNNYSSQSQRTQTIQ